MTTYNVIAIEQIPQEEMTRVWVEWGSSELAIANQAGEYKTFDDEGYETYHHLLDDDPELIRLYEIVSSEYNGDDCEINKAYTV